jgi:DNA-binding NarL/FixJ family response regulator
LSVAQKRESAMKIFIVCFDEYKAQKLADYVAGFKIEVRTESADSYDAFKAIADYKPDSVVLDLSAKRSHIVETAKSLDESKATRSIKLIFLNADEDEVEELSKKLSNAKFMLKREFESYLKVNSIK